MCVCVHQIKITLIISREHEGTERDTEGVAVMS